MHCYKIIDSINRTHYLLLVCFALIVGNASSAHAAHPYAGKIKKSNHHLAADNTVYETDEHVTINPDVNTYQESSTLKSIAFNDLGEKDMLEDFEPLLPISLDCYRPYKHKPLHSIDPQKLLNPPQSNTAC